MFQAFWVTCKNLLIRAHKWVGCLFFINLTQALENSFLLSELQEYKCPGLKSGRPGIDTIGKQMMLRMMKLMRESGDASAVPEVER